ncbi:MAG TPA: acyl-CoA dehydrogenase family protein [Myxococcota bacterium]|nr:acyl-CoA dehydrogenase family protein [Myxococcota bacterium]
MSSYRIPTMSLYVDRLVDWPALLSLRSGEGVDAAAEVGAYGTVLDTVAELAEGFETRAREHWSDEAELTEDGGARPPAHIREAYEQLRENGLICLAVPEAYGGPDLPLLLNTMYLEMVSRADTSLMTVVGLQAGAAGDIAAYGSEEVKQAVLPHMVSGEWQGCMDLTEPQAGSDLGRISTRATEQPDGSIRVDGQKIYITNGGAEVHLVLARDAEHYDESKGTTTGLSLVLVRRHGDDGAPNGVRVTRLERKLGIHGSPTCEVVFDGAIGVRLGEKGKGFRAMLDLMNNARLGVAAQALGISQAAFDAALEYAKQREQFDQPIVRQPLVMAMLAKMRVNVEAARALLYRSVELEDRNEACRRALSRGDLPDAQRGELQAELERGNTRVRLLTPLCKYFATEISTDVTRDAMQVFGGIGFTMDAHVAKLHADSLIMTVYEGTSEIQASFALKEIGKGALAVVFEEVRGELDALGDDPARAALAGLVAKMISRIEKSAQTLFSDIGYALMRAKVLSEMVIDVIASAELLRQAKADPGRLTLAESFVRRRAIVSEALGRRIDENQEGRMARDAQVLGLDD